MTAMHQGFCRYQQMRRHKQKLKKKYAVSGWNYYSDPKAHERKERADASNRKHPPRNGGYEYWKTDWGSGYSKYLKNRSDRRIRRCFQEMIAHMDPEDVPAYKGAQHEKEFDYWWEMW